MIWIVAIHTDAAEADSATFRSPLSGLPVDPARFDVEQKTALARFHVIQARAGHCAVP